jgi:medium-chain acyl-[acyl-carrier-protein] hydrolase
MAIDPHFISVFSKEWEIDFTQCNPNGLLKYTDLCNILQLTAGYHAETGGISFTDMQEFNQAWVLSRMRIEVSELPKWKDLVIVKTWIVSLENSRSVRALELYLNGKKIVGCETFWAVFNTKTRRPESLALPHEHFEKFGTEFSTAKRVEKIALFSSDTAVERKIVLSDLDIVNHVNNVKYLEWCLDIADPKLILKQQLRSLDMNFMKELTLGDQVKISQNTTDSALVFLIEKDEKPCFALSLELKVNS